MRLVVLIVALLLVGTAGVATADVQRAAAAVVKAETARAQLTGERAKLVRRYEAELAEIDKLKRQKASWRRDRALRGKLAASLETARALGTLADKLKRADADVVRARAAVVAVDQALITATGPSRSDLERKRRAWAPAPAPPKKIIIPSEALDPLADPEELEQQAAELRDVEAELAREVSRLEQQATRYDRAAELRRQHDRAAELAVRDESDPRRIGTTARGGAFEAVTAADGAGAPPNESDGPGLSDPSPDTRDFATALSDVVDPSTVDALRRAERSTDPSARAAAARRARDAVNQRLATMRKKRAAIESRARELRSP